MNAATWLGAVAGTAALVLVLILSASLEPAARPAVDEDAATAPTSSVPAPEATFPPGPVLSGPVTLYDAPERVQRISLAPGETIDRSGFSYVWDVDEDEVEGWGPPANRNHPGGPMFSVSSSDSRFLVRLTDTDDLLVDRLTARVFSFRSAEGVPILTPGDASYTLVSFEGRVLFYARTGAFVIIDFDGDQPRVQAMFDFPETWGAPDRDPSNVQALFSPDGDRLALFGEQVLLVDIASGEVTDLGERPLAGQRLGTFGRRGLEPGDDGFAAYVIDPERRPNSALGWTRFSWTGARLGGGSVEDVAFAGPSFSPDGRHIAWNQVYLGADGLGALVISDVMTGTPVLRVLGVSVCRWCDAWLADSSGLIGTTTASSWRDPPAAPLVTTEGALARFEERRWRSGAYVTDDALILEDSNGDEIARWNLDWDAIQGITQGTLAWNEDLGLVHFSTPLLGRDGGAPGTLPIEPQVELHPFDAQIGATLVDPPLVSYQPSDVYEQPDPASPILGPFEGGFFPGERQRRPNPSDPSLLDEWSYLVLDDGTEGWLVTSQFDPSLRTEPSKRGTVLEVLEFPVGMTFLETVTIDEGEQEPDDAYWRSGEVWALVRIEDGREGWILLHALSYL